MARQDTTDKIKAALLELDDDKKRLLDLGVRLMNASNRALYPLDFLAIAALNRSMNLAAGFREMMASRNIICAGAILRLELDTAMRLSAAWHVANPHEFANNVMRGQSVRKMRDKNGAPLTDRHLVDLLSVEFPWVETVYERTCNYVHFSSTHIFATLGKPGERRSVPVKIGLGDRDDIPESVYLDAIAAFRAATRILSHYVDGWIATKDQKQDGTS